MQTRKEQLQTQIEVLEKEGSILLSEFQEEVLKNEQSFINRVKEIFKGYNIVISLGNTFQLTLYDLEKVVWYGLVEISSRFKIDWVSKEENKFSDITHKSLKYSSSKDDYDFYLKCLQDSIDFIKLYKENEDEIFRLFDVYNNIDKTKLNETKKSIALLKKELKTIEDAEIISRIEEGVFIGEDNNNNFLVIRIDKINPKTINNERLYVNGNSKYNNTSLAKDRLKKEVLENLFITYNLKKVEENTVLGFDVENLHKRKQDFLHSVGLVGLIK